MSVTSQPNPNASLASSIVAPHVEFNSLDAETSRLINYCRWVLGGYNLFQLASSITLMILLQIYWASDSCTKFSAYSTSDSLICEIGLPLFVFASFGIGLLIVMSVLGIYGALSVRRLFVSIYLSLSLGLVVFLAFALTLVVSMKIPFVEFGIAPLLYLVLTFVPVVMSILLLRFKSVDKDMEDDHRPSYSMMETVLTFPRSGGPTAATSTPRGEVSSYHNDLHSTALARGSGVANDSILFSMQRPSPTDGGTRSGIHERGSPEGSDDVAHPYYDSRMMELLRSSPPAASAGKPSLPTSSTGLTQPPQRQSKKATMDDDEFMSYL
jgi:hypothetical protein